MKQAPKYRVIAKLQNTVPGSNDICGKWSVSNLLLFTAFLDKNHPQWCWFNVYEYVKGGKGKQLANFTKNKRPLRKCA